MMAFSDINLLAQTTRLVCQNSQSLVTQPNLFFCNSLVLQLVRKASQLSSKQRGKWPALTTELIRYIAEFDQFLGTQTANVLETNKKKRGRDKPKRKETGPSTPEVELVSRLETALLFLRVCFNPWTSATAWPDAAKSERAALFSTVMSGEDRFTETGATLLRVLQTAYESLLPVVLVSSHEDPAVADSGCVPRASVVGCMKLCLQLVHALVQYQVSVGIGGTVSCSSSGSSRSSGSSSGLVVSVSWMEALFESPSQLAGSSGALFADYSRVHGPSLQSLLAQLTDGDQDMVQYYCSVLEAPSGFVYASPEHQPAARSSTNASSSRIAPVSSVATTTTTPAVPADLEWSTSIEDISLVQSILPDLNMAEADIASCLRAVGGSVDQCIDGLLSGSLGPQSSSSCSSESGKVVPSMPPTPPIVAAPALAGTSSAKGRWHAGAISHSNSSSSTTDRRANQSDYGRLLEGQEVNTTVNSRLAAALNSLEGPQPGSGQKQQSFKEANIQRALHMEALAEEDCEILGRELSDGEDGGEFGAIAGGTGQYDDDYDDQFDGPSSSRGAGAGNGAGSGAGAVVILSRKEKRKGVTVVSKARDSASVVATAGNKARSAAVPIRDGSSTTSSYDDIRRYNALLRQEQGEAAYWQDMVNTNTNTNTNAPSQGKKFNQTRFDKDLLRREEQQQQQQQQQQQLGGSTRDGAKGGNKPPQGPAGGDKGGRGGGRSGGRGSGGRESEGSGRGRGRGRGRGHQKYDKHHQQDKALKKFGVPVGL